MIKNVSKKIGLAVVGLALICAVTPSNLMASIGLSMEGYLIKATPFDSKVNSSGAMLDTYRVQNIQSSETLFQIAKSFRYTADEPGSDTWQTPEETEKRWAGDCEDKAVWLYAQLKKNGYHGVRLVVGRFRHGYHVWVTMADDSADDYFVLDPTVHKRIWKASDFPEGYYTPLYSFDGLNRYRHNF